ncbi:MAG: T9SS type A sorting domain-containing protein, partial [Candidatus Kapaibacterium sp.]
PAPFAQQGKSWSFLKGNPVRPSVTWNKTQQYFLLDSTFGFHTTTQRIFLFNKSGVAVDVRNVSLMGPTVSEFSITGDQLGRVPIENFVLNTGDSIWMDVLFNADILKPYPDRFTDRIDTLVATYYNQISTDSVILKLIGVWDKNDVKAMPQISSFTIHPNPASGGQIIVSFSLPISEKVDLRIFDVLGREIYHDPALASQTLSAGNREEVILLPNLETGIYYVRLTVGSQVSTQKLEVVK